MTSYTLYKIKRAATQDWDAWCRELAGMPRKLSAELLSCQGLVQERAIVFDGHDSFLLFKRKAASNAPTGDAFEPTSLALKHFAMIDHCLEPVDGDNRIAYSLEAPAPAPSQPLRHRR